MPPDVGFAVMPYVYNRAVLSKELPYRMITGYAPVLTEGYDNLVL